MYLIGAFLVVVLGITSCSDNPYTGSMMQPGDLDKYLSQGGGKICLLDGSDSACVTLYPKRDDMFLPIIHIHPSSTTYLFYYKGHVIMQAERGSDNTDLIDEIKGEGQGESDIGPRDDVGGGTDDPNNGDPNNGDPNNGDPNNGDPNNGDPNNGDPNNGDPNNGDPNNGDPNNGDPNNGDPNNGDPNNGDPNNGGPNNGGPNDGGSNNGGSNNGGTTTDDTTTDDTTTDDTTTDDTTIDDTTIDDTTIDDTTIDDTTIDDTTIDDTTIDDTNTDDTNTDDTNTDDTNTDDITPPNNLNPSGHNPPDNVLSHLVYGHADDNPEHRRGDGWIVWIYYPHNYVEQSHPRGLGMDPFNPQTGPASVDDPITTDRREDYGFTFSVTGGEVKSFSQTSGPCTDELTGSLPDLDSEDTRQAGKDERDDYNDTPCSASGSDYSVQFFVKSSAEQINITIIWTDGMYAGQTQNFNIMQEVSMREYDADPDPGHTNQERWD